MPELEYKVHYTVNKLGYPRYGKVEPMDRDSMYVEVGYTSTEDDARYFSVCHYLENPKIKDSDKQYFKEQNEFTISVDRMEYYHKWLSTTKDIEPLDLMDEEFINPFYNDLDRTEKEILNDFLKDDPKYSNRNNSKGRFEVRYSFKMTDGTVKHISLGTVEGRERARLYAICHALNNPERAPKGSDREKRRWLNDEIMKEYSKWLQTKTARSSCYDSTSLSGSTSTASSPRSSLSPSPSSFSSDGSDTQFSGTKRRKIR